MVAVGPGITFPSGRKDLFQGVIFGFFLALSATVRATRPAQPA